MTVSSEQSFIEYTGDGTTKTFTIPFYFLLGSDISITITDTSGSETVLVYGVNFSVVGDGSPSGGAAILNTAPASGYVVSISREPPVTQETAYQENGKFPAKSHEKALDKLTMIIQSIIHRLNVFNSKAVKVPESGNWIAPKIADRNNRLFAWDNDGNPIAVLPQSGSASDVLVQLASSANGNGDALVAVKAPYVWAVPRTQHDKNRDVLHVMDFWKGAEWDGTTQFLSSKYSTLAAAQAQYPFVTSLSDSLYWAALQSAVNAALTLPYGATIVMPRGKGVYGTNTVTGTLTGFQGLRFEGQGTDITQLKTSVTGTNSLFNFTYTGSGWWIDASAANCVVLCDMSIVTDQANAGYGLTINGGALTGRPTRGTYLDRVTFRGENGLDQCFARGINLINTLHVFLSHCRFFQSLTNGNGIGFYARVNQLDASNSQVCGGFYFTECESFYGDAWIDLSSYTEGVYLTNCVADGGIKQGVRWLSDTAESGLQIIGGQYNCLNYCFNIKNIIDGCITGADIRCNGGATGWRGISLLLSHGFNITGNNFIGAAVSGLMGVYIDQNNFGSAYTTLVSSNRFTNMDYGVFMTSAATYNHVDSSNVYANVAIPVQDMNHGQNVVIRRCYTDSFVLTFAGGAATETKQITIPAGFFQATQKAECVFAKGSDNDLIGTYLYTSSSNTAVAAQVSFRLTTGGNIPAGTYRVMYQIS